MGPKVLQDPAQIRQIGSVALELATFFEIFGGDSLISHLCTAILFRKLQTHEKFFTKFKISELQLASFTSKWRHDRRFGDLSGDFFLKTTWKYCLVRA